MNNKHSQKLACEHSRKRSHETGNYSYQKLELRNLLAGISFDPANGILTISGTDLDDSVLVSVVSDTMTQVQCVGVETRQFETADIQSIQFFGRNGNDSFTNQTALSSVAFGDAGIDELRGGSGVDRFFGGDGNDRLFGGDGNDELFGNAGNDELRGEFGLDMLSGGLGNDILGGGRDSDVLYGGSGDDDINGGRENDQSFGHDGNDRITNSGGQDLIVGHAGNDRLFGNSSADRIFGGIGDDSIGGLGGDDELHGGDGRDSIRGGEGNDLIFGGPDADTLRGDERGDTIFGGEGNDMINGGSGGQDRLFGQQGNDTIYGGEGIINRIFGGAGNDRLIGGIGQDFIFGADGDDFVEGDSGNDEIFGGSGNDHITGGRGDDLIAGLDGNDFIGGGQGNDMLFGGNGNDFIRGASDNDLLVGGDGNDRLFGMAGSDQVFGNDGIDGLSGGVSSEAGPDILRGGNGSDRFLQISQDTITDMQPIDVLINFQAEPGQFWVSGEVQAIDRGLHQLHVRTGNNALLSDPRASNPLLFEKVVELPPSLHVGRNVFDPVESERRIQFESFNHFDDSVRELIQLEVIREMGLSWASDFAISRVLPNESSFFSEFESLSTWTVGPVQNPADFIESGDGSQFYSVNANFAEDVLATRNSREDFASIWRLRFDSEGSTTGLQNKLQKLDELFALLA